MSASLDMIPEVPDRFYDHRRSSPQLADEDTVPIAGLWKVLWYRRRMIFCIVAAFLGCALLYGLVTPPLYKATAEIIVDPRDKQVVANDVNPSAAAPDGGIAQIESQSRVLESSEVLLRAIAATGLTGDPEFNARSATNGDDALGRATTLAALRKRLSVKRADKVFVIEVAVTARDPEKAARLANAITDAYLADQAAAKAQSGKRATEALSAGLNQQQARVQEAENKIQQ